jgi:hypothetical protein
MWFEGITAMAKTVSVIGVNPAELPWLHLMVWLLRHPDPVVAELTRKTMQYLEGIASRENQPSEICQNG